MRVTIVYLVNKLRNSGPIRVMLDIIRHLDREQFTPVIITLTGEDKSRSIKDRFVSLGVEVVALDYNYWQLEFLPCRIAKHIESICRDYSNVVYHSHSYQANNILAHIKSHSAVATIHCISGEDYLMNYGALQGRYMSWRFRSALRRIAHPVAISDYMTAYYSPINGLQTIVNGVERYIATPKSQSEYKRALGCEGKFVILVSGGFNKRKNQQLIINELKALDCDFVCIFIGKGDTLQQCTEAAAGDSRFRFDGYVFNVGEYLSAADVVVSASYSEGMPLAVLESLTMGCPVLLSNIPPHIEICNKMEGEGVQIFDISTSGSLAAAVMVAMQQVCDREAIANRSYEIYSAKGMSENYQRLYLECINK